MVVLVFFREDGMNDDSTQHGQHPNQLGLGRLLISLKQIGSPHLHGDPHLKNQPDNQEQPDHDRHAAQGKSRRTRPPGAAPPGY